MWDAGARTSAGVSVRVSVAPLRARDDGASWSAGRATLAEALGAVEGTRLGGRLALRLAAGAMHVSGPRDVAPFRHASDAPLRWTVEGGGAARPFTGRPLYLTLGAQAFPLGGAAAGDPSAGGVVARLLLGVRHGR